MHWLTRLMDDWLDYMRRRAEYWKLGTIDRIWIDDKETDR